VNPELENHHRTKLQEQTLRNHVFNCN